MLAFMLTSLCWLSFGFAVARYVLGQNQWSWLIPGAMGLGVVLHTALLNALLHFIPPVDSYWLSLALLVLMGLLLYFWGRRSVAPLTLGAARWSLVLVSVAVLLTWALILPPLIFQEYFDSSYHYNLAGILFNRGLPVRHPWNLHYCTYYHYGDDVLAAALFRASQLDIAWSYGWVTAWCVLSVLGLAVNVGRLVTRRQSLGIGLLAAALFFFAGNAGWIAFPLTNPTVRAAAEGIQPLEYFYRQTNPASLGNERATRGTTLAVGTFTNPYSLVLHTRSMNPAWLCAFLALSIVLSTPINGRRTWLQWLLLGLILGTMALFYETFWPVLAGMVLLYGLYLLVARRQEHWRTALYYGSAIVIMVVLTAIQGGVITDTLFCSQNQLTADASAGSVTTVQFPLAPGYVSWQDGNRYSILQPGNWLRWLAEWGLSIALYPILLVHYWRKRNCPVFCLLLSSIGPVLFMLCTEHFVGVDAGRLAVLPLYLWAFLSVDWFVLLIERSWPYRLLAVLMITGLCYSGVALLYGQAVSAFKNPVLSALTDIDRDVQTIWYGKIGDAQTQVLGLDADVVSFNIPLILGTYTALTKSRSSWDPLDYVESLRQYPDPQVLITHGIEFLYVSDNWWNNASDQARQILHDSGQFEQVFDVRKAGHFRVLYRVLGVKD